MPRRTGVDVDGPGAERTLPGRRGDGQRPRGLVGRPSAAAPLGYRLVLRVLRLLGRGVFGFRPELVGRERLPRAADGLATGGWIAAGMPHRTWVDPFLVADLLPPEPRLWFFGDGRAILRARWRRFLVARVGGVIPIWPGGGREAVEAHIASVEAVIRAGAVLVMFPEVGPPAPPGSARQLGLGVAYFALRTGAPVVPLAIGGSEELFRGRRLRVEALEPVTARDLAGLAPDDELPPPWSAAERALAHEIAAALHARSAAVVAAAHAAVEPLPGQARRWRWLTTAWH